MVFLPTLSIEQKQLTRLRLRKLSQSSSKFYIFIVLSVIISTLGLIKDSTAIIIGAMLISPLMDPILCLSSSITTGHRPSLNQSFQTLVKGITLSILIAALITTIIPIYEIPSAISNRANPSLIDLFIALAAGAAGMYSIVKKSSSTLPGVAISSSLIPPLSVIGIGLAIGDYRLTSGAWLLFLTNLIAIIFIGSLFLLLFGLRPHSKDNQGFATINASVSLIMLIGLSIILSSSFIQINQNDRTKAYIKTILTNQTSFINGEVTSFTIRRDEDNQLLISANILASQNLSQKRINLISGILARNLEESVKLQITLIPTIVGGTQLSHNEIEQIKQEKESSSSSVLQKIENTLISPHHSSSSALTN